MRINITIVVDSLSKLHMRSQTGSTIVEVLLALAISGAVISGAFVAVNQSTQSVQQSQERSEAVKVAESQIESVRSRFTNENVAAVEEIKSAMGFCISNSGDVVDFGIFSLSDFNDDIINILDNLLNFPEECFHDGRYGVHMSYASDRLTTTIRWERLGGGIDQVRLIYGFHEVIDD